MFSSEGVKMDMIYEDLHDPLKYLYSWKYVKIDLDILNGNYVLQVGDLYSEV